MVEIAVSLDDAEARKLSDLAREVRMSEQEVIRRAIEALLLSSRGPRVPRYARHLGPLALPD